MRFAIDLPAACRPARRRGAGWPATVKDVSAGGIGLLLRHRFPIGTPLVLELRLTGSAAVREVSVRVVHAVPVRSEGVVLWRTGCMFPAPLSDGELQSLLCPPDSAPSGANE